MPAGGKRTGAGRKPAQRFVDAWIAWKVNELALASVSQRATIHFARFDRGLKSALDEIEEKVRELERLEPGDRDSIVKLVAALNSGHQKALDELPPNLRDFAEDFIFVNAGLGSALADGLWLRRGGRRVPPLSPSQWSDIYQKVAKLASQEFARQITKRAVADATARETRKMRNEI